MTKTNEQLELCHKLNTFSLSLLPQVFNMYIFMDLQGQYQKSVLDDRN